MRSYLSPRKVSVVQAKGVLGVFSAKLLLTVKLPRTRPELLQLNTVNSPVRSESLKDFSKTTLKIEVSLS